MTFTGIATSAIAPTSPSALPSPPEPPLPSALPLPPELPVGIPESPRVIQLIDLDSVSHGLVRGTHQGRASNQDVLRFLDIVQGAAQRLDPESRVRCAASSATALHHLDVLMVSGNNQWSIRRGLNGADRVLLEEMNHLINTRLIASRPGGKPSARHAELVILAGKDHIYAPSVRRLRLLGIPTWLVVPGRHPARSLRSGACAVSYLGPDISDLTTWRPVSPAAGSA